MKKIFSFILMLLSVVTLASCGGNNPTTGSTTTQTGTTIPTGKQAVSVNSKTEITNLANEIDKAGCLEDIFIQDSNSGQKRARRNVKQTKTVLLADKGEEEGKSLEDVIGTRELYNEVVTSKNTALNSGIAYLNAWSDEIEHDSLYEEFYHTVNKIKYRLTVDEETNSLYIEMFDYVDHFVDYLDGWDISVRDAVKALNPEEPEVYEYTKITVSRNEDNKIYYEYIHNCYEISESYIDFVNVGEYGGPDKWEPVKYEKHREIYSFEKVEYLEDSFYTFLSYNKEPGFPGISENNTYSIRQADLNTGILYYTDVQPEYYDSKWDFHHEGYRIDGVVFVHDNCYYNRTYNKVGPYGAESYLRVYRLDKIDNIAFGQDFLFGIVPAGIQGDYKELGLDKNYTWVHALSIPGDAVSGIKGYENGYIVFSNGERIECSEYRSDICSTDPVGIRPIKDINEYKEIFEKYGLSCSIDLESFYKIAFDVKNIPGFNEELYSKTETDALIETVSSYLINREDVQKDYENVDELKTPFNLDLTFSYTADGGELITLGRKSVLKFEIKMEDIKSPIAGQIDFGAIPVLYLYIDGRMVAEQVTQVEGNALTVAFNHVFDEVKDGTMKVEVKLNSLSIDIPVAFVIVQGDTPETKNVTVDQAVDIIDAMDAGEITEGDYIISGVISRVVEISEKHKDITILIKDPNSGSTKQLYLFRCKKNNGAEWENFDSIVVGATIKVQGYLQKYVKRSGTTYYEIVAANVITESE